MKNRKMAHRFSTESARWPMVLAVAQLMMISPATLMAQPAPAQRSVETCSSIANGQQGKTQARNSKESWDLSVEALKQINQKVYNRTQVIEAMASAILAGEFVWMNGEPGGAKTYVSRLMFQSVLNSIPESDKQIFVLQFHKLISEGKISGFQKFSSMMKEGKYEIETSTSLVGDRFLFLIADEAEKANPAVLNALLSVLNERKAFLGSRVVDAVLSSGVFTSNKTTGEFIQGFFADRPSGEAMLDRMAMKIHILNQQLSPRETIEMYNMVKNSQKVHTILPLSDLAPLLEKVKIPDTMMARIVEIVRAFDPYIVDKWDKSREAVRYGDSKSEYFPANQFSNRSVRRVVTMFKASLITSQLMEGIPFDKVRLQASDADLVLLAKSAAYIGPTSIRLKTFGISNVVGGQIQDGGVSIVSDLGVKAKLQVVYSPFDGRMYLQDLSGNTQMVMQLVDGKWVTVSKSDDFADYQVEQASVAALGDKLNEVITANNLNLTQPEFEVDRSAIAKLKAKGTVKDRTMNELESIYEDLVQMAAVLTRQMQTAPAFTAQQAIKLLPPRTRTEIRQFRREVRDLQGEERASRFYAWMQYEVRALNQRFVELEHSVTAHLTGISAGEHLYVFGPPGGAKTALAEVILKAEISNLNSNEVNHFITRILSNNEIKERHADFLKSVLNRLRAENKPQVFERFLLQFHKLLPEGVLVGFPKIEKQMNDGIEEIDVSTSLAAPRFIFAILDEVDKANPQTITALLSILNEREVFHGSTVIKAALRTAILTSNKMPSEFLESYNEDRTSGEAVMDRAVNMVYVSNKISTTEGLTQFLINLEKGISPKWTGFLGVKELEPLVKKVEFVSPAVQEALAAIHAQFLAKRIKVEQDTKSVFDEDDKANPDYYVSAAGSASDRTFIKLLDQFSHRFIVQQLVDGVPYDQLKYKVSMEDLHLFFEGLGYWAPQKIKVTHNADGMVEYVQDSTVIDQLLASGVVDHRVRFHLQMMKEEGRDYVQVTNAIVQDFMTSYKTEIARYPELFPTLLKRHQGKP